MYFVHDQAKLPMLVERRLYHSRIRGFKVTRVESNLVRVVRTTRANTAPLLKYNIIHSAAYERSIEVVVARAWNGLPKETRNIERISVFKSEMKKSLEDSIPKNTINMY